MQKVLSTKLGLDELESFAAMAEQQGESKSSLLRRLVLDYLNTGSRANTTISTEIVNPVTSSKNGLPLEITNTDDGLPLKQSPSSERSLSVYYLDSKGSPEASTKSSTGKGWLLLLILLALWLKSQPSITVDRACQKVELKPSPRPLPLFIEVRIWNWGYQ